MSRARAVIFAAFLSVPFPFDPLWAASPTDAFDLSKFDINNLLTDDIKGPIIRIAGFAFDYRAYQPATPLGMSIGVDVGAEVTIMKAPQELSDALAKAQSAISSVSGGGSSGSGLAIPFLPAARVHLHKGLGPYITAGFGFIFYQGMKIYGGHLSGAFFRPVEGPTLAARISYSKANVTLLDTNTITPQLIMSRSLGFADPYIGVGYQYVIGKIVYEIPGAKEAKKQAEEAAEIAAAAGQPQTVPDIPTTIEGSASGGNFIAFLGVKYRVPWIGLMITIEGGFSQVGTHNLGAKVGLSL